MSASDLYVQLEKEVRPLHAVGDARGSRVESQCRARIASVRARGAASDERSHHPRPIATYTRMEEFLRRYGARPRGPRMRHAWITLEHCLDSRTPVALDRRTQCRASGN